MSDWNAMSFEVQRREQSRFHDAELAHNAPKASFRLHLGAALRRLVGLSVGSRLPERLEPAPRR